MMTETQRAAMQAAHNALKTAQNAITFDDDGLWGQYQVALNSITAALAEPGPADEPVAWTGKSWIEDSNRGRNGTFVNKPFPGFDVPLYTSPQRREPLTDEQIMQIAATQCAVPGSYVHTLARAIEAAHGIGEKP